MMHLTLYWGVKVTLLFDSWTTNSPTEYALALLLCFLIAVFYQRLEALRFRLKSEESSSPPRSINAPLIGQKLGHSRVGLAAFVGVNAAIGYLIMLAVMSYNGGVLVVVVSGFAVGYYFFRSDDFGGSTCACS